MTAKNQQPLAACIDTIESSYEYMLAYAAQGREKDSSGGDGPGIRDYLTNLDTAVGTLHEMLAEQIPYESEKSQPAFVAFLKVLEKDSGTARKAIQLVLSLPQISSRVVDNLNASAHLRTLLTDMFLVDEALKSLHTATQQG